ncbi:MAG TPA: cytochrome c [Thermoanaerobaculia bacterium]|nr:cytochrome c [Thermoanaerobaculia bacterium]
MKRLLKFVVRAAAIVAALAVILVVVIEVRSRRTFDAPDPDIHASADPQVIARGAYLAYGPAHCVNCHTSGAAQKAAVEEGATPPLAGGNRFSFPPGTFYSPNLTPDKETGIGRYTDGELARMLRYGVRRDGRAALPFMEFQHLSDEDLTAVISFLRSQQPVRHEVPPHKLNLIGKAVMAFAIKPIGPKETPPKVSPAHEPTVERGAYLANSVAGCAECHTKRNPLDGSYVAARFSGGGKFEIDKATVLVTPNLTPSKFGRIRDWEEEQFVGRFDVGMGIKGTHMPWRQFQRMSDTDKRAIFRYLKSLRPVDFDPGPIVQKRKT